MKTEKEIKERIDFIEDTIRRTRKFYPNYDLSSFKASLHNLKWVLKEEK